MMPLYKALSVDSNEWIYGYFYKEPNISDAVIVDCISGARHIVDPDSLCAYINSRDMYDVDNRKVPLYTKMI